MTGMRTAAGGHMPRVTPLPQQEAHTYLASPRLSCAQSARKPPPPLPTPAPSSARLHSRARCCRDEINLFDPTGTLSATVKWSNTDMGTSLHYLPDGSYQQLPEGADVLSTLRAIGGFNILLDALKVRARGWLDRRPSGGASQAEAEAGALVGACT